MEEDRKTTSKTNLQINKKRNKWKFMIRGMIFICGLCIFAYPIITNLIYERVANTAVNNFDTAVTKIEDSEIKKRLNLAYAYNDFLLGKKDMNALHDPYTKEEMKSGVEEYANMLSVNELLGHIIIPKISVNLPIYAGTSEEVLQKGIGHLEGTSLPVGGNYTHAVLSGHRGLPTASLFNDLNKLEIGDRFYIKSIAGTLAYQVDQIKTVEPTDFTDLAIVPGHDYCTLLTCTPYMINSHRLLVRGHRVEYVEAVVEQEIHEKSITNIYKNLFYAVLIILVALIVYILSNYIKNKRRRKNLSDMDIYTNKNKGTD